MSEQTGVVKVKVVLGFCPNLLILSPSWDKIPKEWGQKFFSVCGAKWLNRLGMVDNGGVERVGVCVWCVVVVVEVVKHFWDFVPTCKLGQIPKKWDFVPKVRMCVYGRVWCEWCESRVGVRVGRVDGYQL
jgi:hypothetical protein